MEIFQEIFIDGLKNYGAQVIGTLFFIVSAWLLRRYKQKIISGLKLIIYLIFAAVAALVVFIGFRVFGSGFLWGIIFACVVGGIVFVIQKRNLAEAERKAKEEAERKAREEAERKAREEAERKAREEAERKAREEAERKAKEEAERKAREEAERKAREEAERKAREEAERKAREEAERKAREEAERKAKEEAERKAREEAERVRKKTYDQLIQEIIDNNKDLNHIYDCLDEISANYSDVLSEKYSQLFNRLYNNVPHVCYALLGHHATRPFYVLNQNDWNNVYDENNLCFMRDSKKWYLETPSLTFQDRILRTDEKLDEIAQRVSSSVREKLSIINQLRNFSLKIFTEKIGEKYADSCWVINKKYFFLESRVYDITGHSLHDEFEEWFSVEASNKKFMLFYGDEEDHRFTSMDDVLAARFGASKAGGLALAFASINNHNNLTKSSSLSLNFPVLNGIDAVAVCVDYSLKPNCNKRGFCYIEARC